MAAIPKDLLAKAAHACGAHARALQYYELHVRESKGGRLNSMCGQAAIFADDEVSFLQVGMHVFGVQLLSTRPCRHVHEPRPCSQAVQIHDGL